MTCVALRKRALRKEMLMCYVARRGMVGRSVIAGLGGLMSILFVNGCSDDRGDPGDAGMVSDAPAEPWMAVPVEGTICRDGQPTGYAISKAPGSRKLMIYMEGGGACFNPVSCLQNPESWPANETSLMKALNRNWILSRSSANSPFK